MTDFRAVCQLTGVKVDRTDAAFNAARDAEPQSKPMWMDLCNSLIQDLSTRTAENARLREVVAAMAAELDRLSEQATRLQELEAENRELTTRLAVAQEARNTAGVWGRMGEGNR